MPRLQLLALLVALCMATCMGAFVPVPAECESTGTAGVDLTITKCTLNDPTKTLDLRSMGIVNFQPGFASTVVVNAINVASNLMTTLPTGMLNGITIHGHIDLSNCHQLTTLETQFATGIIWAEGNWGTIYMDTSSINTIQPHAFQGLNMTNDLDLMFNGIDTLVAASLAEMHLGQLTLDNNPMNMIDAGAFTNTVVTGSLTMNGIGTDKIGARWFVGLDVGFIDIVYSRNLTTISANAFSDTVTKQGVTIANNKKLSVLEAKAFQGLKTVDFDLHNNAITEIPNGGLAGIHATGTFNLVEPLLTTLRGGCCSNTITNGSVTMSDSASIETIEFGAFYPDTFIGGDFPLGPMLKAPFAIGDAAFDGLTVKGTLTLTAANPAGGVQIASIAPYAFTTSFIKVVDLSYTGLTALPARGFDLLHVGVLNLTGNPLTSIEAGTFENTVFDPSTGMAEGIIDLGHSVKYISRDIENLQGFKLLTHGSMSNAAACEVTAGRAMATIAGTDMCTDCPTGHYCPGNIEPRACPFNTYSDKVGLINVGQCTPCGQGMCTSKFGAASAGDCHACQLPPVPPQCESTGTAGVNLTITKCTLNDPTASLDLDGVGALHFMPGFVDGVTLQGLRLTGNIVTTYATGMLDGLTVHGHIDLSNNPKLTTLQTGFLGDITWAPSSWGVIYIDTSVINTIEPNAFQGLSMSSSLDIMINHISVLQANSMANMQVGSLALDFNPLFTIEAGAFTNTKISTAVSMEQIGSAAIGAQWFAGLTAGSIQISTAANLTTIATNAFAGASISQEISFRDNPQLSVIEANAFAGVNIVDITLSGNQIEVLGKQSLAGMRVSGDLVLEELKLSIIRMNAFSNTIINGSVVLPTWPMLEQLQGGAFYPNTFIGGDLPLGPLLKAPFRVEDGCFDGLTVQGTLSLNAPSRPGMLIADIAPYAFTASSINVLDLSGVGLTALPSRGFDLLSVAVLNLTSNPQLTTFAPGTFQGMTFYAGMGMPHGVVDAGESITFIPRAASVDANPAVLQDFVLLTHGSMHTAQCQATAGRAMDTFASADICTECPIGHYCPGNADPVPCPMDTYRNMPGAGAATDCAHCPAGSCTTATGSEAAAACQPCGHPTDDDSHHDDDGKPPADHDHAKNIERGLLAAGAFVLLVIIIVIVRRRCCRTSSTPHVRLDAQPAPSASIEGNSAYAQL